MDQMTLGIDVACRAAHQAGLADARGRFAWSVRRFRTTSADLERLWSLLPAGIALTVVMEPTPQCLGAAGHLVPPPTPGCWPGCRCCTRTGCGPPRDSGPLAACGAPPKLRACLVKRRSAILARLDAYLGLLGPAWDAALGGDLALNTPLRFLAAGYAHPHMLRRLGRARLTSAAVATISCPSPPKAA